MDFSLLQNSVSFSQIFSGLSSVGRRNSSGSIEDEDRSTREERERYSLYLRDARSSVRACLEASRCWQYEYDGTDPPPHALDEADAVHIGLAASSSDQEEGEETALEEAEEAKEEGDSTEAANEEETAASSGYTSLVQPTSSLLLDDEDREFWNLMRDPSVPEAHINRAIRRMQQLDEASNASSIASSSAEPSPRDPPVKVKASQGQQQIRKNEDVDLTVTSLGEFSDSSSIKEEA